MAFIKEPWVVFKTNNKDNIKISEMEQLEDGLYCSVSENIEDSMLFSNSFISLRLTYTERYDVEVYKYAFALLSSLLSKRLEPKETHPEEDNSGLTYHITYNGTIEEDELFSSVVLVCRNILRESENEDYALRLDTGLSSDGERSERMNAKFNEYREQIRSIITGFVRGLIEENKYIYEVERDIW